MSEEYAGQSGRCPACGQTIRVPPLAANPDRQTIAEGSQWPTWGDPQGGDLAGRLGYVRSGSILAFLVVCVLLFAFGNLVIVPLTSGAGPNDLMIALVFTWLGTVGAQGGLHAVWCVLAPVGFIKRLAVGVGTGLILFVSFVLGFVVSERAHLPADYWETVVTGLLCLPLMAVAIQSPLWLARVCGGWRILHRADLSRQSGARTFGIRDILVATAVVALALSAARLAVPDSVSSDDEFLLPLAIAVLAAAGISMLTTLPVVVATLRTRRMWLVLPAALLLDVVIAIGFGVIMSAIEGYPTPWEVSVGLVFLAGSLFACLAGVLLVVRGFGFRLSWGRRKLED